MKIAMIAPTHLPARRANTLQVMKMAQAFSRLGHAVQLAIPALPAPGEAVDWPTLKHFYGLQVEFPLTWVRVSHRLRRYDYGWKSVSWSRRQEADLVYTRLPQAAALASWLGQATVLEIHELPQGTIGKWLVRRFAGGRGARRRRPRDDRRGDARAGPGGGIRRSGGVDAARTHARRGLAGRGIAGRSAARSF